MSCILYRLPYDKLVHELSTNEPCILPSFSCIGEKEGYVFAPFHTTQHSPILLFSPKELRTWILPKRFATRHFHYTSSERQEWLHYQSAFEQCLQYLCKGKIQKLVLSRKLHLHLDSTLEPDDRHNLFIAACNKYPDSFVSLIELPTGETWLTATPEILVEQREGSLRTMALAATMSLKEGKHLPPEAWSDKNKQEQQFVADYIAQQLDSLSIHYSRSRVYVRQAAHLVHLCTDFTLSPSFSCSLGKLISTLHPTPAVCGLPMPHALRVIHHIEQHERGYYAGFSGPVGIRQQTALFVTLRCMQLQQDRATLYSGGGLLASSIVQNEWVETQRKMKTMLHLLQ